MIKPSELRIGNWVNGNRVDHWGPMQIRPEDFVNGNMNWIVVIILTDEILQKCGFTRGWVGDKYTINNFDVSIENGIGTWYAYTDDFGDPANGCDIRINNLHHLQNLYFSVTGEELEVKL